MMQSTTEILANEIEALALEVKISAVMKKLSRMDSGVWSRGGIDEREIIKAIILAAEGAGK